MTEDTKNPLLKRTRVARSVLDRHTKEWADLGFRLSGLDQRRLELTDD
jgi:hypothetical protein